MAEITYTHVKKARKMLEDATLSERRYFVLDGRVWVVNEDGTCEEVRHNA